MLKVSKSSQHKSVANNKLALRLYIADRSPNSVRALTNLHTICQECFSEGDFELEIVDIFEQPLRAIEDHILVTPTLLILTPPRALVVGDLSQPEAVLSALGLSEREI